VDEGVEEQTHEDQPKQEKALKVLWPRHGPKQHLFPHNNPSSRRAVYRGTVSRPSQKLPAHNTVAQSSATPAQNQTARPL